MDYKDLFDKLKALNWKKRLYPLVSTLALFLTLLFFLSAVRFLSASFNKIFLVDQSAIEAQMVKLDINNLNTTADKLNITIAAEASPPPPQPQPEPETTKPDQILGPPVPAQPAPPPPVIENKTELKLQVLNSTKTSGLAGGLKTDLENAGFSAATGNSSPTLAVTAIKIKDSKKPSFPTSLAEIKQIVDAKYEITEEILDETSAYDVVIIIGSK